MGQMVGSEPSFRAMALRYSQLMKIRSGCARAAEVIESITLAGADFQELWRGLPALPSRIDQDMERKGHCLSVSALPSHGGRNMYLGGVFQVRTRLSMSWR